MSWKSTHERTLSAGLIHFLPTHKGREDIPVRWYKFSTSINWDRISQWCGKKFDYTGKQKTVRIPAAVSMRTWKVRGTLHAYLRQLEFYRTTN